MSSAKSTTFRVEITHRAELDLRSIYNFVDASSSDHAGAWFLGLTESIFSLASLPERGTVTRESKNLRQLYFGARPHTYRIIYRVLIKSRRVVVLHIRHGARDDFSPSDVAQP